MAESWLYDKRPEIRKCIDQMYVSSRIFHGRYTSDLQRKRDNWMEPITASSSQPSSSSSSTRGCTHDIFLSFRGEDTRNTFIDHLYAALTQKGIQTFKDDEVLGGGKPISQELLKAIKESRIAVVVFSKNYANSSWCLEELSEIMECHERMRLKVLPVFYHVDPSDVRGQKGEFATAFEQHEDKFRGEMEKMNKWRKALAAAANISGYHISTATGGESAIINKIVQEILGYMPPRGIKTDLIGMESRMAALNSLLDIEATDKVRIIGIYGMGGIGKTTIARILFRRIANKFEGSSFVNDVKENSSSKKDICALQEKILRDILVTQFMIQDPEYGVDIMQERFCNKKVLLVLDDVNDFKQLEFLAARHEWFGPGSRIIITTRDEHLLSDADDKYKPALLRMDQAVELFSRHAFRQISPPDEYMELSKHAISYTGRLPLALKVLGSFFRGRKAYVWESALDKLAKTPNDDVYKTLKLSFDELDDYEKKIFLDIACFFKGRPVNDVTRILDSFGFYAGIGITSLIEKSLITVSKNRQDGRDTLDMHDLIQEMGWQVVRESAPSSRLWKKEEIYDFIEKNKELELIEAIVMNLGQSPSQGVSADVLKSMKNLRLLVVDREFSSHERTFLSHEPTFLPSELRWLYWNIYPFSSIPLANACKLVGLEMANARIERLWEGQKSMPSLKFIYLQNLDCLTRFPDVSGAPNIERLVLFYCKNLVEVHESLGYLKKLVHLDMSGCDKLRCLPSRIEMDSLETLMLGLCTSLKSLPEFSPHMVKLTSIDCGLCFGIEKLPSSINNVSNLIVLVLQGCSSLKDIPYSISELKCLKVIDLAGCSKLQRLPHVENLQYIYLARTHPTCFSTLPTFRFLQHLFLNGNPIGDQDFPLNFDGFSSLEKLDLSYNSNLTQLPASISHLSSLKHLNLNYCQQLESIVVLPSRIQNLDATNCVSLERIKDLSEEHEWLQKICLVGCKKLLEHKESERYLDKMLNQSFLKKKAARDCSLSIGIPGSKIPSWFKEQRDGSRIAVKLPVKWQTEITGFAICGVFKWNVRCIVPRLKFRLETHGLLEVDCTNNASAAADDDDVKSLWIGYVPFSLLEKMNNNYKDDDADADDFVSADDHWSDTIENLVIELSHEVVRCGVHVLYKDDVETTQQIMKPSISSSWHWHLHRSKNTFTCR